MWDLDPQGAASFYFRVKPRVKGGAEAIIGGRRALDRAIKGTDYDDLDLHAGRLLVPQHGPRDRRHPQAHPALDLLLRPLAHDYDYAFLDCPPSISLVSENVFRAADVLLVPLIPTTLSIRTLDQLDSFLDEHRTKHRPQILAFFSMVDQRKNLHRELIEKVRADRADRHDVLDTQIPATSDIERMGVHRAPLPTYAPARPIGGRLPCLVGRGGRPPVRSNPTR